MFKTGDHLMKDNYCLISILTTVSKIMEKVAIINSAPTLKALINFTDGILDHMDQGKVTGVVFLELCNAFDTVDHVILVNKLKAFGSL